MYILGIDFGGGASKATLLSDKGKIVATAKSEYETITVGSEGREQRPSDWVKATAQNIKSILDKSKIAPEEIKCLCFDAATHTAVLMDEDFNVVRNSVYWTDTRSVKQKKFLQEKYGDDIFKRFYHKVDTIWSLPELLWVKENEPETFKKVKKIMFSKDYVRHCFTGDYCTDNIEAEGSMLFDFNSGDWSSEYLSLLDLKKENMPKIVNPLSVVGSVTKEASLFSGLKEGTPVICGSTDTVMEVFASGAVEKGQMTVKLATAGRICLITDSLIPDANLVSYSHLIDGLYYPGTATKSCAASLRWFRDTFGGEYRECDEMAETVSVGSDGLIFNPYLSGELTPFANPLLKGSFIGISALHTKAHFIRSVMEGAALSLKDCMEYLKKIGKKTPDKAFIIGGSSNSKVWKQIVADCLNISLITTENNDSSFGSAMCAGIAIGIFKDFKDAVKTCQVIVDITNPIKDNVEKYDKVFKNYKKVSDFLVEYFNDKK